MKKEIMKVIMYEHTELFIELLHKYEENPNPGKQGFLTKSHEFDPFQLLDSESNPLIYFKPTKEFMYLEELLSSNTKESRADIKIEDIILFEIDPPYSIQEEISLGGIEDFLKEEVLMEWVDFLKENSRPNNIGRIFEKKEELSYTEFFTVWEWWSEKYWTDCGYEYDGGCNYIGILDLKELKYV